jgi:Zn-dependent metalloprotease
MKTKIDYTKRQTSPIKILLLICAFLAFHQVAKTQIHLSMGNPTNLTSWSIPEASFMEDSQNNSPYPSLVRLKSNTVREENFLPWLKDAINLRQGLDFNIIGMETDELGFTHYKLIETYLGVPIDGAIYMVHAKNGYLTAFNGRAVLLSIASANPTLSFDDARASALNFVGADLYAWEDSLMESELQENQNNPRATHFPYGELVWRVINDTPYLTYKFDIYALSPMNSQQRIFVEAHTGNVLKTLPLESNCDAAVADLLYYPVSSINTDKYKSDKWRLKDDCQNAHIRIRDWNSNTTNSNPEEIDNSTNTWTTNNEVFGATVLWTVKNAYQYFLNIHNRDSYNNNGGNIQGFVNALFDGNNGITSFNASMSFKGGDLKVGIGGGLNDSYATQDILGHEFTHAVTGATAELEYEGESGALNESFSDIFGEVIEHWQFGSNDWLMGAERSSGEIRDMSNPSRFNDPATYMGFNWISPVETCDNTNDDCGVHTNSGVQNYWFYLICEGGSGTNEFGHNYEVTGIGIQEARRIAYRTLVNYLGPNSNYNDARNASIQAAIDIFGVCSDEVKAVADAWFAVGIGKPYLELITNVTSTISCHGGCDGKIFAFARGTFLLTADTTLTNLCAGQYNITVTDNFGCEESIIIELIEPEPLVVSAAPKYVHNGVVNISCFGGNDGGAIASVSGGTPPYKYLWNTGDTTESILNLTAGVYWVEVSDSKGCTAPPAFVTLIQPSALTAFALPVSDYNGYNVSCHGGQNGSAEAFPIGGVPPYHYEWDDYFQNSFKKADSLKAKTYTVEIRDANYCIVEVSVTLTEPPVLSASAQALTNYNGYNISCNGGNDGAAEAIVVGGVSPYQYLWDDVNQSQNSLAAPLSADTYHIDITDDNNCMTDASVTLIEPEPLFLEAFGSKTVYYGYTDSACAQLTTANAMGGVPPYTLEWSTGETTESINVCPNVTTTYYLTITDQHGCSFTDSVLICVIDVRCGNNFKKIQICQPKNGKNGVQFITKCVGYQAAVNHLANGALLGDCNADRSCSYNENAKISAQNIVQENEVYIEAYPNPFHDRVTLSYIPAEDNYLTVDIIDITGKTVGHIFNGHVIGDTQYTFDYQTTELPNGMYFIKLETSSGIMSVKKVIRSSR